MSTKTPTVRLSYFDFDGSRGLEGRLALTVAGVPFEDVRVGRGQWMDLKPTLPFGALPVLEVDGAVLPQSNAILTWIGRTHDLHPADPWRAAEHEALMQSVEDLRAKVPSARDLPEEDKKVAREAFAHGWLSQWAEVVSSHIQGPFLEGEHVNVADIKLYVILRAFMSGGYDHIPGSFFDGFPKLKVLHDAVDAHPAVQGWFASR